MMHMHQRSININRVRLLDILRENLAAHKAEYAEALTEYHARLVEDLRAASEAAALVTNVEDLRHFSFNLPFPQSWAAEYQQVIDMLEYSVDENIELDAQAFRAYVKNEWAWSGVAHANKMAYATRGAALGGSMPEALLTRTAARGLRAVGALPPGDATPLGGAAPDSQA